MKLQSSLYLFALATAVFPSGTIAQDTNFGESCVNIMLVESDLLEADCPNNAGTFSEQVIGLNSCLANVNGALVCQFK